MLFTVCKLEGSLDSFIIFSGLRCHSPGEAGWIFGQYCKGVGVDGFQSLQLIALLLAVNCQSSWPTDHSDIQAARCSLQSRHAGTTRRGRAGASAVFYYAILNSWQPYFNFWEFFLWFKKIIKICFYFMAINSLTLWAHGDYVSCLFYSRIWHQAGTLQIRIRSPLLWHVQLFKSHTRILATSRQISSFILEYGPSVFFLWC